MGSDGEVTIDEGLCSGDKPAETVICAGGDACIACDWEADEFQACPGECDSEEVERSRSVTCACSDGNVASDEVKCTAAKPHVYRVCAATEACISYNWQAPGYDLCPDECGMDESIVTRDVSCVGSDGTATDGHDFAAPSESLCNADLKPDALVQCPAIDA